MPLILPNMQEKASSSSSSDKQSDWENKLLGKTISPHDQPDPTTSFAKKDLPEKHRVIEEGAFTTMDHDADRYVIILGPLVSQAGLTCISFWQTECPCRP
jgi:hypothetical protein